MKTVLFFNLALLIGIAVFAGYLISTEGLQSAFETVGGHMVTFTVSALLACLIVFFGGARADRSAPLLLVCAALIFVNAMALTYAPLVIVGFPEFGNLNWSGKSLSLLFAVIVFALLPRALRRETGILALPKRGSYTATGIALGLFAALGVALAFSDSPEPGGELEAFAFQLTLPSLSEEFLFRGILLALFAKVAVARFKFIGAPVNVALIATSLLFGLVHGFLFAPSLGFIFQSVPILATGFLGALFAWLTLRSGSAWPAVIAHSLLNATGPGLRLAGLI